MTTPTSSDLEAELEAELQAAESRERYYTLKLLQAAEELDQLAIEADELVQATERLHEQQANQSPPAA